MADWKSIIGTVAPVVASGLFGPAGGLVAAVAGRVLFNKADATPEEVRDYVVANQNPEVFAALKKAELELTAELEKLGIERERLAGEDRKDARQRQAVMKDWTPTALALAVTVGFFGLLGLMAFHATPETNQQALYVMLGALGTGWISVLTYYFGSSAGSAQKTDALTSLAESAGDRAHAAQASAPVAAITMPAANANAGAPGRLVSARPSRAAGT